jgi:hypothetical protein
LRTIAQSSRIPLEVHFASDMQKSSLPPAFADLRLGSDTNLVFHSVADSKDPNWMVESVTAPAKIYDPKKVRVQAVIAGSNTPAAKRTVSLALDGKVLESKSVDVPANGRARSSSYRSIRRTVSTKARSASSPATRCAKTTDSISPSNEPIRTRCCFCIPPARIATSCTIAPRSNRSPKPGFTLEPLAVEQAANQSLSKYAFVVLSDVGSMPPGLENSLRAYVAAAARC